MTYNLKNVLFFPRLSECGGVETFCYEMALKYGKDYDITVVYRSGDPGMIQHLSEVARVIRYRMGDTIKCDVFIFGHLIDDEILKDVEAKQYIQTLHADYVEQKLVPCFNEKVDYLIGVSENTTKRVKQYYGVENIKTVYNPYVMKKPRKVLKLISPTRIKSEEHYERMEKLAAALEEAGYPFRWDVYTDDKKHHFKSKSIAKHESRLDILDFIADADYLVQLSDTEGYSYSILEALSVGTPVITTPMPTTEEQGVFDGETGFVLPFDMSRIPVDDIYKGIKLTPVPLREDGYADILVKGKAKYAPSPDDTVTVRCIQMYNDLELGRMCFPGDIYDVKRSRGTHLENCEFAVIEG